MFYGKCFWQTGETPLSLGKRGGGRYSLGNSRLSWGPLRTASILHAFCIFKLECSPAVWRTQKGGVVRFHSLIWCVHLI